VNPASLDSCTNCWQSIVNQPVLTREEATKREQDYKRRQLVRRLLVQGLPALMLVVLVVWFFLPRSGPGEGMAPPAGNLSAVSGPNEWAYYRNTPEGTAAITTDLPLPRGSLKWKFDAGSPLVGAPVVAGDRVFITYEDNHLAALDRETGALLWKVDASGPIRGAATIAGDRVIVGQLNTHVVAHAAATGQVVWDTSVDESIVHPVNVRDGVVYASGLDGTLFTLDAQTGARRWDLNLASSLQSSPIVLGDTLVIGTSDRSFNVMDAKTGKVTLDYASDRAVESGAVLDFSRRSAYFGSNRGSVFSVDIDATNKPMEKTINYWWTQLYIWNIAPAPTQSGTRWVFPVRGAVRSGLALAHGNVYAGTESGILYAINADTGDEAWKFPASGSVGSINTAVIVINDIAYFGASDNIFYAVNAVTGQEVWRFVAGDSIVGGAAYANAVLFVPSEDGSLYALE
jgi:outer membrane protein assembly factor BamB